ncbi:hypothetical protein [Halomarina oriensis]|uniref:Uncharacterized protein n=1 Tax=Halomarina oriensis TaxID=671145 RepID=A0A6B0GSE4_9EURY|nr:hypothetical protein [Halomarina oriensis]MWG36237.1 hypothetical protein [Halomarina oriensis]
MWGDKRREKSTHHREAAKSRWESATRRTARLGGETLVDVTVFLLRTAQTLVLLPLTVVYAVLGSLGPTARNARSFVGGFGFDRAMPPALADNIQFYVDAVPAALGIRDTSRDRMFYAASGLAITFVFLGVISLGTTLVLAGACVALMLVALARLNPGVNKTWQRVTGRLPIKNDYDVPLWERD